MRAAAVDLGGSHATCAVVEDRTVLAAETIPIPAAAALGPILPRLAQALHQAARRGGLSLGDCVGLAFGFCGLVDPRANRILSTNRKYDDGPGLDLPLWAHQALGLPLRLENDARLALLGERQSGAAEGFDDVVMITLGTGIGGAAMIEGRLVRGRHFQAGCLGGHLPVRFDGRPCSCGGVGCVEAEASTAFLPDQCREWPGFGASALAQSESLGFEEVFAHARGGDRVAVEIRDRCMHVWAAGAVALVHAYDPEVVVLGGGVMRSGEEILPFVESWVHAHAWTPWGRVQVRPAALGDRAALLGAVPLLEERIG